MMPKRLPQDFCTLLTTTHPLCLALRPAFAVPVAFAASMATPLFAQDAPNNSTTLTLSTGLSYNDNADLNTTSLGTTTAWENRAELAVRRSTRRQSFALNLGGAYLVEDEPFNSENHFDAPSIDLDYALTHAKSSLSFGADYRESDISDLDLITDTVSGDLELGVVDGTRKRSAVDFEFVYGEDEPVSFAAELSYGALRYDLDENTSDDDFSDNETLALRLENGLRLSDTAQLSNVLSWRQFTSDDSDNTERLTRAVRSTVTYALNKQTAASTSLGYRDVETDENDDITAFSGLTFSAGLTRDHGLGEVGLDFDHTVAATGERDQLIVSYGTTSQLGALDSSLGVSHGESGDNVLIGSLQYGHTFSQRSSMTLQARRSVSSTTDLEDRATTRASLSLQHALSANASLGLNASYSDIQTLTTSNDDSDATNVSLSLNYALTEDVTLVTGYQFRESSDDGSSAQSNSVFFTLSRAFTWLN